MRQTNSTRVHQPRRAVTRQANESTATGRRAGTPAVITGNKPLVPHADGVLLVEIVWCSGLAKSSGLGGGSVTGTAGARSGITTSGICRGGRICIGPISTSCAAPSNRHPVVARATRTELNRAPNPSGPGTPRRPGHRCRAHSAETAATLHPPHQLVAGSNHNPNSVATSATSIRWLRVVATSTHGASWPQRSYDNPTARRRVVAARKPCGQKILLNESKRIPQPAFKDAQLSFT